MKHSTVRVDHLLSSASSRNLLPLFSLLSPLLLFSCCFSCFSLDDVLEFRVFANHLSLPGAEQLTVRGLVENADIQADPYSQALLQELTKSGVLQWNQALSLEDLMQACVNSW